MDRADVAATFVGTPHAPVEAYDLVADRVDVIGRVEVLQLMRQQLPDAEEDERADAQQMVVLRMVHDCGDLAILVAVHVDATVHGQGGELVVLLALLHVLRAEGGLEEEIVSAASPFGDTQRASMQENTIALPCSCKRHNHL